MRIQSIRLKNIKSYGEGPEGNGITIGFQPGVNRVAGRNGHGKTTMIEALGYALFFSEPEYDENFKLQNYFLRAGEKEAEIDVVFAHEGEAYRVERALGTSKRKSKLIQVIDESTCAEGDNDVAQCLCRILRADQRTFSQGQLSDLFSNLIGVKQGRLAWPFDSKPAAAKEFFEPLLDVAIFRESESRLRDARNRFDDLLKEQDLKLAAVKAQIMERASSRETVPVREAEVEARRKAVEKSRKQKEEADKHRQALEQKQTAFNAAKTTLDEAGYQLKLAVQKREQEQKQCAESQAAAETAKQTEPGHLSFLKAEEILRGLHQKQVERSTLGKQRESASQARGEAELKMATAQQQIRELEEQRKEMLRQTETLKASLAEAIKKSEQAKLEYERFAQAAATAKRCEQELNAWLDALPEQPTESGSGGNVSGWDTQPILKARAEETKLAQALRAWEDKGTRAEHARQSLAAQLAQIAGGVCPFLNEKCRQFDPKAVQSDLSHLEKELAQAGKQRDAASKAFGKAKQVSAQARTNLLKEISAKHEEARGQLDSRDRERVRAEENLKNEKQNLERAERGLKEVSERSARSAKETVAAEKEVKLATERLADLDEKLKHFSSLDQELQAQQHAKDKSAKEHQTFLQNQPLAAKLEGLQAALKISREGEARAAEQLRQRTEQFEQAARDFDPEKLRGAESAVMETRGRLAVNEHELDAALAELKKEKERLNQWKQACEECDRIENAASRQRAAAHLAKVAAKILKDAAPAVAQHLCGRIAAHAQRIFNQINHEPIELEWKAEPHYSLRIVPGNRRFAMLSGGEQTKLALAMTLAMIQEFSGLHFAVFDEPTYAVDSESRQKLADAILEAQKAAGLEQLIVVSHDDAFEGKIENVVMLRKTAAGTELVTAG